MELIAGTDDLLLTEPCRVEVRGLSGGALVDIEVVCDYGPGPDGVPRLWRARGQFAAAADGSVEVCGSEPVAGDWVGEPDPAAG